MKKLNKGFTLIELLVVIAIIGVLASVVITSLNTARQKGADAAIKSDLAGVRSSAEVQFDILGSKYGPSSGTTVEGVCPRTDITLPSIFASTNVQDALAHAKLTNGGVDGRCNLAANGSAYAVAFPLKTAGKYWCVDSSGISRGANSAGNAYDGTNTGTYPALAALGTVCQ